LRLVFQLKVYTNCGEFLFIVDIFSFSWLKLLALIFYTVVDIIVPGFVPADGGPSSNQVSSRRHTDRTGKEIIPFTPD